MEHARQGQVRQRTRIVEDSFASPVLDNHSKGAHTVVDRYIGLHHPGIHDTQLSIDVHIARQLSMRKHKRKANVRQRFTILSSITNRQWDRHTRLTVLDPKA